MASRVAAGRDGAGPAAGRVGRPRDPERAGAIRAAVLDLLVEHGYERVTVEAIAARAGAGKATVYRRWPSKAELVLDAVASLHGAVRVPDTGSLTEDVTRLCTTLAGRAEARTLAVLPALTFALRHDTALAEAFAEHFVAPRRAALAEIFARAVARGEMSADKDIDLLTSVIPAMMLYKLFSGAETPGPQYVRRIAAEVLLPAATQPSAAPAGRGGGRR